MENTVSSGDTPVNIVERARDLLLQPSATWEKIATETATVKGLMTGYVAVLAAIPAIAMFIGTSLIGMLLSGMFGGTPGGSLIFGAIIAVLAYLFSLLWVYVYSLVINFLAPNFGAQKNTIEAFKVAAYSGTAIYVACIAEIIPLLGGLIALLGLFYSIYLLSIGLKKVMKAPDDKAVPYTAVVCLVMIIAGFVASLVLMPISGGLGLMLGNTVVPHVMPNGNMSGKMAIPGVGSVDLGKLETASKQAESAASAMSNGQGIKAVEGSVLQALLPATLDGSPQLNVESESGGAGGMNTSTAKAVYNVGSGGSITLSITDMGAAGAFAAMGSALNVNHTKQTATGYEKITTENGQIITEDYDNTTQSGKYAVVTNNRLAISAEGEHVPMDKIKAAVNAVDKARAMGLMK